MKKSFYKNNNNNFVHFESRKNHIRAMKSKRIVIIDCSLTKHILVYFLLDLSFESHISNIILLANLHSF